MDAYSTPEPDHSELSGQFRSPSSWLAGVDPEIMGEIAAAAADVALIVDDGIIRDIAVREKALISEGYAEAWIDKPWVDTVTSESRPKIEQLLLADPDGQKWRQVNHPSQTALDVPIRYTAIQLGSTNRFIALGRDLRSVASLQQRLVEAHQELERDYVQMREVEGRYRLLFDTIAEPVIIVNARTLAIEDANPSAGLLVDTDHERIKGRPLVDVFAVTETRRIDEVAARCVSTGSADAFDIKLVTGAETHLTASAFREGRETRLIVRLTQAQGSTEDTSSRAKLLAHLDDLPDALVLADADQRIIAVNAAFGQMMQMSGDASAKGERLQDFLGRSGTDLNVLFSTLKKHGVVRNFATVTRDRYGMEEQVEVSAVAAPADDKNVYAFSIRNVSRRMKENARLDEQLPSTAAQFIELVGRVPLKDIVRESTALIERLCIEAALEISNNNRASAAEMLGLSRQGLYLKLKRVGLTQDD